MLGTLRPRYKTKPEWWSFKRVIVWEPVTFFLSLSDSRRCEEKSLCTIMQPWPEAPATMMGCFL